MSKRILLIDDEKDLTEIIKTLFEFHGFQAEAENDPLFGLQRLQEEKFDAAIVDIMMPRMDGLTLVKRVREQPKYATLPLFILSAKDINEETRKELLIQQVHFIAKPCDPRYLVELVEESLSGA
jgi:DNA-binding response OmpR family regulator